MSATTEVIQAPMFGIPGSRHSDDFTLIAAALVAAIGEIETASKDAKNPHFNSKYADLTSIVEVSKSPLAKNGIGVMQPPTVTDGDFVTVTTILLHKSGQWMACELTMRAATESPQAIGSTITYARRYGLSGILGITAEDDDGNAASDRSQGTESIPERFTPKPRQASAPAPAPKPGPQPATGFKMLEAFAGVKSDLKKLTGTDEKYYGILGAHGYEKSTHIPNREKGASIYGEMRAAYTEAFAIATEGSAKDQITDDDIPDIIGATK